LVSAETLGHLAPSLGQQFRLGGATDPRNDQSSGVLTPKQNQIELLKANLELTRFNIENVGLIRENNGLSGQFEMN